MKFTIGGAIVGLFIGAGVVVAALVNGLGVPGWFELLFIAAIVGVFVALWALTGFLLGWIVSLFIRKR